MEKRHHKTVLERFMLPNPMWEEGYRSFSQLFERPLGWLFLRWFTVDSGERMRVLNAVVIRQNVRLE